MKAWYFSNKDCKLRYDDGRLIEAGITHTVKSTPKLCNRGLHASERVIDALKHAPNSYIWFVNVSHKVDKGDDKICGQRRKYYWGFDASDVLRAFARKQALINIEKAKPYFKSNSDYNLVVEFLMTGKADLRSAAESVAWSAAKSAAESVAKSAAESAANEMLETMIIAEAKRLGVYK
jgi:hypothetical protein